MSVSRLGSIQLFQCLTSDTKPTTNVPVGSQLFETNSGKAYKYNGSTWVQSSAGLDQTTFGQNSIDIVHHEIHEGDHWTNTHYVSVGTATAATVMITTPGTTECHMVVEYEASNSGVLTFSKIPDVTAGTAIVSQNNNQIIGTSCETAIVHTVTYASSGTILENHIIGGSNTNKVKTGDVGSSRIEWVGDNSTEYLVKFDADNAATRFVCNIKFYEVE